MYECSRAHSYVSAYLCVTGTISVKRGELMIFVCTYKYLIFFWMKNGQKNFLRPYVYAYVCRRLYVYECSRVHSYVSAYLCVTGTISVKRGELMIFIRTYKYLIFFYEKFTKDILPLYVYVYVCRRLYVYECSRVHSYVRTY